MKRSEDYTMKDELGDLKRAFNCDTNAELARLLDAPMSTFNSWLYLKITPSKPTLKFLKVLKLVSEHEPAFSELVCKIKKL
jgi:DNA-binding transcriptional regulator YiaG